MDTLTVWRFDTPAGAASSLPALERLASQDGAAVDDAALVTWNPGRRKPSTRSLGSLTGPGRLWGGFWGVLLGLVFLAPLAGPTLGAAAGAVAGGMADFGLDDEFVMQVREGVVPGTSAVFVVSSRASADRIATVLDGLGAPVVRAELSHAQAEYLREALAEGT
jgi:uncharacterized membrane protein